MYVICHLIGEMDEFGISLCKSKALPFRVSHKDENVVLRK